MPYNAGYVSAGGYSAGYVGTYTGGGTLDYQLDSASHGTAHPNSVLASANFATTGNVQLGIVTDTDQSKIIFDWDAINTGQLWLDDINTLDAVTVVSEVDTTAFLVMAWETPEGESGQFTANIQINEDGVVVIELPQGTITIGTPTISDTSAEIPFTYSDTDQDGFEYSLDGGAYTSTTSPVLLTGLTELTGYSISIRAVNAGGDGTAASTTFTTEATPVEPQVPAGLISFSAPQAEQTEATVSFAYDEQDADSFEYSLDGGAAVSTSKTVTLTGLTGETTYQLRVRAVNAVGVGDWFSVNIRTLGEPVVAGPDNWPFSKGIKPKATKNWTYGSRHPMTGMRVRIYK